MERRNFIKGTLATLLASTLDFTIPDFSIATSQENIKTRSNLENQLNIDILGTPTSEQKGIIDDTITRIHNKYPKSKEGLNLVIKLDDTLTANQGGHAILNNPLSLEDIETQTHKDIISNGQIFKVKENSQKLYDIILINPKQIIPQKTPLGNMFVDESLSGMIIHETGHILTLKHISIDSEHWFNFVENYASVNKAKHEYFKNISQNTDNTGNESFKDFNIKNHHIAGYVSPYGYYTRLRREQEIQLTSNQINEYNVMLNEEIPMLNSYKERREILKQSKKRGFKDSDTIRMEESMIDSYFDNLTYIVENLDMLYTHYYIASYSEDLAETFTYSMMNKQEPTDMWIRQKQNCLDEYLTKTWG